MDAQNISQMDTEVIDKNIEKKIGKKLKFEKEEDSRLIGRGSVYIYLFRLISKI